VLKDVTEKRRMEGAERRAAKLESLGVLAGGIAHDFNNLLSGIFGYLDMAMRRLPEADPVHDYLAKAGSVFGRARDLTRQLLTFAKGGDPQRSASDLGPIVRASVSFALSGSNVDSTIEIEEGLPLCMIDPNQIAQAIDNVVINAKQAMPEGGRVKVRARSADPARERLPGRGRFVALSISDQGGGIPKERLEKVFDPFYTTKPKGTGLGLATVFSIAQRHGGSVEVESELGAGTTFTLFLPAAEEGPPAVAAKAAGKRDRPPGPPGARILVMDDEEYMRDLYVLTLEAESYRVSAVEDGAAAIKAFSEALSEGDPFSVAILDLTVPGGMGGRDAAAIIRPAARGAPIIAASGYASDPVMADPGAYGFDRSLGKPFLGGDLVAMVASLLD
jgi:CheY-like chemotaxis protein/two-component sensor histidine kinase